MAGEIEQPFRFNFQADLLHSGSISFGRFESEPLSWERRSSFLHNPYLEEVERYSKPGSVTEKKAYFEAHFRRMALLKQNSSESQKSDVDDPHVLEEFENQNDSKYNEDSEAPKYGKENGETLHTGNDNESRHCTSFDETPLSSGYNEEARFQEGERKKLEFLSLSPQDDSVMHTVDHLVGGPEHLTHEEGHQSGTENVVLLKSKESNGGTLTDMASEANNSSFTSYAAEKDDNGTTGPQRMFSPKATPASERKVRKPKLKAQGQRTVSSEASNASTKAKSKGSEWLLMKNKEKKSARPASPVTGSGEKGKTSKSEELSKSFPKAKELPMTKRNMKELTSEKAVEAQSSVLKKSLPANRPKQLISPSKPERKKEEKAAAADMKQLRKSLNFKATPMPSFYNESARNKQQVISRSKTPSSPCSHPVGTRAVSFSTEAARKAYIPEKKK